MLAYLALDLRQADAARVHGQAAFQLGDRAEHDQLRAWAVKASNDALAAWKVQYSPGDEMLTQIYLASASASARLGELDDAIAAVAPVLEKPPSHTSLGSASR